MCFVILKSANKQVLNLSVIRRRKEIRINLSYRVAMLLLKVYLHKNIIHIYNLCMITMYCFHGKEIRILNKKYFTLQYKAFQIIPLIYR